jgi:hypothetical protein
MNTDNVTIVILLVIGIVVLSNLAMFAFVRGSRNINLDWFRRSSQSFKATDESLDELRKRVGELENDNVDLPEKNKEEQS